MNLYLKYRPNDLDDVIGNKETMSSLNAMLEKKEECPHAFLLTGESGCGKTTVGRIIAKRLGVEQKDIREINSADFRGIDTVREIIHHSAYTPLNGDSLVWLIDECHKLTNDAQNALLKTLEDTPEHVYFILATTEPNKLIKTIRNRCIHISMSPLKEKEMLQLLRKVVRLENEEIPKIVYDQIVEDSKGHPRNALQILDQVLRVSPEQRLKVAQQAAEEQGEVIELCRALLRNAGWKEVRVILESIKTIDSESIRRIALGYCSAVLMKKDEPKAGLVMEMFHDPLYSLGFPGVVYACYSIVKA